MCIRDSPCTAGTPYWDHNIKHPNGPEKLREHQEQLGKLLEAWGVIAETAKQYGWAIAFEWPEPCSVWQSPWMKEFKEKHNLQSVILNGCMLGLVSRRNKPMLKTWRIDTDVPDIQTAFEPYLCTHKPVSYTHLTLPTKRIV